MLFSPLREGELGQGLWPFVRIGNPLDNLVRYLGSIAILNFVETKKEKKNYVQGIHFFEYINVCSLDDCTYIWYISNLTMVS